MPASAPDRLREARDCALAKRQMQVVLLQDMDGLRGAFEGFLYFANGNDGHGIPDFPEFRLSERAARFCGLI